MIDCETCKYFDGEDCTIIVDEGDDAKCLKEISPGVWEYCPLYGGYPKKETADA